LKRFKGLQLKIMPCCLKLTGLLALLLLNSCAINPPEISSISKRLIIAANSDKGDFTEQLSLMVSVRDKDGFSDIEHLYVLNDPDEIFWALDAENWIKQEEGDAVWIGHNSLRGPEPLLPRGDYRLVLVDRAGERDERALIIREPVTDIYDGPRPRLEKLSMLLDSPYTANTAFFFDAAGNVRRTVDIKPGTTLLDELWPDAGWRTGADYLAVYAFNTKSETGYFSWKIRLPD